MCQSHNYGDEFVNKIVHRTVEGLKKIFDEGDAIAGHDADDGLCKDLLLIV